MSLVEEIQAREVQFSNLHTEIGSRYAALKIAYDEQRVELTGHKRQAYYWEAQFKQVKTREQSLQLKLDEALAKLGKREQQLFGRRSEKHPKKAETNQQASTGTQAKKKRGQQPGSKGHGRRSHSHLPQIEETQALPPDESHCPCCGLAFEELAGTEESCVVEIINVKAYQRVIHRKRYKRNCQCQNSSPKLLSAPNCAKVLPKSTLGVSVWGYVLVHKYGYHLPLNRILQQLAAIDLSLPASTLTAGLEKLIPLLSPIRSFSR